MGGFSFTWSSLRGNYSGLASSDEVDINGYGRTRLTLSLNVDNVTNNGAAQRLFPLYNQDDPALTEAEILAHFDYRNIVQDLDPRFLKEYLFMNPISARFGIKFGF